MVDNIDNTETKNYVQILARIFEFCKMFVNIGFRAEVWLSYLFAIEIYLQGIVSLICDAFWTSCECVKIRVLFSIANLISIDSNL